MRRLLLFSPLLLAACLPGLGAPKSFVGEASTAADALACARREMAGLGYLLLPATADDRVVRGEKEVPGYYPRSFGRLTATAADDRGGRARLWVTPARYEERLDRSGQDGARLPTLGEAMRGPSSGGSDPLGAGQGRRRAGWRRTNAGPVAADARAVLDACGR
jgi:hypothetical protein